MDEFTCSPWDIVRGELEMETQEGLQALSILHGIERSFCRYSTDDVQPYVNKSSNYSATHYKVIAPEPIRSPHHPVTNETMGTSTIDLDRLIQSCYEKDLNTKENVNDLGRQIQRDSRVSFSSCANQCDDGSKIKVSLKYMALLIQMLGSGPLFKVDGDNPNCLPTNVQRIRVLNCITGALLGCSDLWNGIEISVQYQVSTHSSISDLIENIGRFILVFCEPLRNESQAWEEEPLTDANEKPSIPKFDSDTNHVVTSLPDDEDVRDAAMECSCALLKLPWVPNVESASDLSRPQSDLERQVRETILQQLESMLQNRIHIARQAVVNRCSSMDYESTKEPWESDVDARNIGNVYDNDGDNETLLALSLLVRSRRSLCFSVLQSAVQGMASDLLTYQRLTSEQCGMSTDMRETSVHVATTNNGVFLKPTVLGQVHSFISFISSCLLGETDPRCLIQMMNLLQHCQKTLKPLFSQQNHTVTMKDGLAFETLNFPMVEIFDAVAPYYPIQFTPPPNNIHGITREGLHRALMSVLCYFDDSSPVDSTEDTMTNLAAKLFLERINPTSTDTDEKTVNDSDAFVECLRGLEDLSELLIAGPNMQQDSVISAWPRLFYLSEDTITIVSSTLFQCHEIASVACSTPKDVLKNVNACKSLTASCTQFLTTIVRDIDCQRQKITMRNGVQSSGMTQKVNFMWQVFVADSIIRCTNSITSSLPSLKGRSSLEYLGSLAACGVIEILLMALRSCIPALTRIISAGTDIIEHNSETTPDYELMSSAAYGISLLFSSSKITLADKEENGLSIHPHPLQGYFQEVTTVLCKILITMPQTIDPSAISHRSPSTLLRAACVKSLEAVLLCSPSFLLDQTVTAIIEETLYRITEFFLGESKVEYDSLNLAISQLLGHSIGKALSIESSGGDHPLQEDSEYCIFSNSRLAQYVRSSISPAIMEQALGKDSIEATGSWTILSNACLVGSANVSTKIIAEFLDRLKISLQQCLDDDRSTHSDSIKCIFLSKALSYILCHGGESSRYAFFNQSTVNLFTLVDLLTQSNAEMDPQMSTLLLPREKDDLRRAAHERINLASRVMSSLLPVYLCHVPSNHVLALVSFTSQILPPLSEWDNLKLILILPILAGALVINKLGTASNMSELLPFLVEYSLNTNNDVRTRTHAISVAFTIIEQYLQNEAHCPVRSILTKMIFPDIVRCCESLPTVGNNALDDLINLLFVVAIMGAAAAARGGDSLHTADEVIIFLVHLSCHRQASKLTLISGSEIVYKPIDSVQSYSIQISAVRAYGSMLSWDDDDKISLKMIKQRLSYVTLPLISLCFETVIPSDYLPPFAILTHIICNVSIKAFSLSQVNQFNLLLLRGLDILADTAALHNIQMSLHSSHQEGFACWLGQLTLSSVLKICVQSEQSMISILPNITSSLLLYCTSYSEVIEQTPNLLLCLQLLMNFVHMEHDEATFICNRMKDKVLLHLSCLIFSPSLQVRRAAVQVRNIWALIGISER